LCYAVAGVVITDVRKMKVGWKMLVKKAMSLRGAAWAKALGATRQSRSYTGRHALATRLPRYARNDMLFYAVVSVVTNNYWMD
jgi:hypothetical protein